MSFKLESDDLLSSAKSSIEICVQEINDWMIFNGLKLNEEKTACTKFTLLAQPLFGICSRRG